jgi:predicted 2-oxoglutarate/Fe(II)-dependent dioxygenase YbiX
VLVSRSSGETTTAAVVSEFAAAQNELGPLAQVVVVNGAEAAANQQADGALELPFPLLADPGQGVADALGLPPARETVTCVIADPNRRILRIDSGSSAPGHAAEARRFLESRPSPAAREIEPVAPVLAVPGVFDAAFCRRLIDLYETGGHSQTGVFRDEARPAGGKLDARLKIRRDHIVQDPAVNNAIGGLIGRRVVPEVLKAFSYQVAYVKEFKIGCYEASDSGFFRPHRDNIKPTGGRRFAMSLNLNTGDYEGGHLRFPEYGPHLYRPAAGEAVIFSCALLHEAMPVTAGRRFVLLSFFYGAEGE